MAQPLVSVRDVRKRFGNVQAVDGVSFSVVAGRMLGLLGGNGAGKSTSIRMVLDIIRPDSGEITVFGGTVNQEVRERIGFLPEERGLYGKMRVGDLLVFMGMARGMRGADAKARTGYWLERLELADRRLSPVSELSKGNQQKIQLAATLIHDPELLILDEPFSGLDPVNRHIFETIITERRDQGRAVILCTHILEQAERLVDEVVMLRKGKVVVQGPVGEVRRAHGAGWIEVRGTGVASILAGDTRIQSRRDMGDGTFRVKLPTREDATALLRELVQRGIAVERFAILDASLNDIFLEKVGGIDMGLDGQPSATA